MKLRASTDLSFNDSITILNATLRVQNKRRVAFINFGAFFRGNISRFRIFTKLSVSRWCEVFWVFEDLKFKISEGSEKQWCFPDTAQLAVSV